MLSMPRLIVVGLLVVALVLATAGSAGAHRLTVTPPGQDEPVLLNQPLAANITPKLFDENGDRDFESPTNSAASQGTNQSCEAVHSGSGVVDIDGGTCSAP